MAYARVSKTRDGNIMRVRLPLPAQKWIFLICPIAACVLEGFLVYSPTMTRSELPSVYCWIKKKPGNMGLRQELICRWLSK